MPPKTITKKTPKTVRKPATPSTALRSAALPQKDLVDIGSRYSDTSLYGVASHSSVRTPSRKRPAKPNGAATATTTASPPAKA